MDQVNGSSYPRTGKRGVPQQFPRRLYNMLEAESQLQPSSPESLVSWSQTGKAFRIEDVTLFSTLVLPKYFRTNKFSSFQRNLNLYGFTKVRRGPDTDMYAHPSFLRGYPDMLSELKKCKSAADRKRQAKTTKQGSVSTSTISTMQDLARPSSIMNDGTRAVSPSSSSEDDSALFSQMRGIPQQYYGQHSHHHSHFNMHDPYNHAVYAAEHHARLQCQQMAPMQQPTHMTSQQSQPAGKLDLLTLAITCLADSNKQQSS
jgi:hypothetical protein